MRLTSIFQLDDQDSWTPEHHLWFQVLHRAMIDYAHLELCKDRDKTTYSLYHIDAKSREATIHVQYHKIKRWFGSTVYTPGSFRWIIGYLLPSFDTPAFQKTFLKKLEEENFCLDFLDRMCNAKYYRQ